MYFNTDTGNTGEYFHVEDIPEDKAIKEKVVQKYNKGVCHHKEAQTESEEKRFCKGICEYKKFHIESDKHLYVKEGSVYR